MWRISDPRFSEFMNLGLIKPGVFLAGGIWRGLFDKHDDIVDFDLFFENGLLVAETAVQLEQHGYKNVFTCPAGELKTYIGKLPPTFDLTPKLAGSDVIKIQLITKRYYQDCVELINTFDVDPCRFGYDGQAIYCERKAIKSVKSKELTLHTVTHPNATLKRLLKYQKKNYKITNQAIALFTEMVYTAGVNNDTMNGEFYVD